MSDKCTVLAFEAMWEREMYLDENKRGLVQQAIVIVGMLLFGLLLIVVLAAFGIMSSTTGFLIALVAFVGVALLIRQNALAKEIDRLRKQSGDLAGFERSIDRKTEKFSMLHQAQIAANDSIEQRIKAIEASAFRAPKTEGNNSFNPDMAADDMEKQDTSENAPSNVELSQTTKAPVQARDLTMHLQPIVQLSSRKPVFYDGFVRLSTGNKQFMDNDEFAHLVERGGLSSIIDQKVVSSAIRMVDSLTSMKKKAGIFCAISPETMGSAAEFAPILDLLSSNKATRSQILIKISQRDFKRLDTAAQRNLVKIADMGYRLALTDIYDFEIDAEMLATAGFRYVFTDAPTLRSPLAFDVKVPDPSRLVFALRTHDIELVVTSVHSEAVAADLAAFDVDFGQGLLFAPPRPVKPELLDERKDKPRQAANA